jgi:hypothetical protein
MSEDELKILADHMDHSVSIRTDVYQLQSSILEHTKVVKALVALEAGELKNYKGRNLSSIDFEGK